MLQAILKFIRNWQFVFTVVILFAAVNVGFFSFFDFHFSIWDLLYALVLEYIAFGIIYDLAELLYVSVMPRCNPPRNEELTDYPRVALLCCTCDDVDIGVLTRLSNQIYPNLDIFILDDSRTDECNTMVDSLCSLNIRIIRRDNRAGYKAGNLNNWLFQYGACYQYFAVADADSILPDDFIEQMVRYAEHPGNAHTAIFESYIQAWNVGNRFARLQNVMAHLYQELKSRLDNRMDTNLSVGHNNLYRSHVIMNLGGFSERYVAEDYATSAQLLKGGKWHCKTVPVVSYERLPENLSEYSKRQARWAFQTLQLLDFDTSGLSVNLRLKLLVALHHHSARLVALFGMVFLIVFSLSIGGFSSGLNIHEYELFLIRSNVLLFWVLLITAPIILRVFLVWRQGISCKDYLISTLFHSALFVATIWPVSHRLINLVIGDHIGFNVTGTSHKPSVLQILRLGWPGFGLAWAVLVITLFNSYISLINLLWVLPAAISPLVIYYFQKTPPRLPREQTGIEG